MWHRALQYVLDEIHIMKRLTMLVASVVCLGAFSPVSFADDGFYKKDFAKGPFDKQQKNGNSDRSSPPSGGFSEIGPDATPTPPPTPTMISEAVEALGVSAIMPLDDGHATAQRVLEFSKAAASSRIQIANIFLVGDHLRNHAELMNLIQEITQTGDTTKATASIIAAFRTVAEVPSKYAVKSWPAWVFHLRKGDVVIEGAPSISPFLSGDGKFLEPVNVVSITALPETPTPAVAAPTPK